MNQVSEKIINIFKNNKEILAIYTFSNLRNIFGQNIKDEILNNVKNILENFKKNMDFDYITFNMKDYTIIAFKYNQEIIIIFGVPNIKEPVIRVSIKSL
ncbi:MAG: hypothetical protein RMJ36_01890 [Candidatus Calescibacterium sp.]|nr:hypothetical protein [Candidatus Calescibacterium sp.]MDW8132390.1 hypothetical protein [Candidatus Calescibacterium sp.]